MSLDCGISPMYSTTLCLPHCIVVLPFYNNWPASSCVGWLSLGAGGLVPKLVHSFETRAPQQDPQWVWHSTGKVVADNPVHTEMV